MGWNTEEIKERLQKELSPAVWEHCERVAELSRTIAEAVGADAEDAYIAGLLHDIACELPGSELLKLCDEYQLIFQEEERKNEAAILHGAAAAIIAARDLGIDNSDVLFAICNHSGRPGMILLEKVVFLADLLDDSARCGIDGSEITQSDDIDCAIIRLVTLIRSRGAEDILLREQRTKNAVSYIIKNAEKSEAELTLPEKINPELLRDAEEVMKTHGMNFRSVENIRDLGGYRVSEGMIRKGCFVRSANLSALTEEEAARLYDHGIRCIIDLRDPSETAAAPDIHISRFSYYNTPLPLPSTDTAEYRRIIMNSVPQAFNAEERVWYWSQNVNNIDMEDCYHKILSEPSAIEQIQRVFQIFLSEKSGGILFHCTSGKDRTGVIAALLMKTLGADRAETKRDYYASLNAFTERSEDYAKQFTALGYPADVVVKTRRLVSVSEDMFDNIYTWLCERYGSPERYLNEVIGLSATDRECLRRRSLEKYEHTAILSV